MLVATSLLSVIKFEAWIQTEMNRILWITRIAGVARSCSIGAIVTHDICWTSMENVIRKSRLKVMQQYDLVTFGSCKMTLDLQPAK